MANKKLNIFDFIKLILNNKLKLLIATTLFLLIGLIFSSLVKPAYKGKIIVHPLSLVEFENFYVSENKIFSDGRIGTDEIALKQLSPLTLFYSFLNTLKKEKHNLELKNFEIQWNFLGGQHEIYLIEKSKDYKSIINNFTEILKNSNTIVLEELIINLEKEIKLINTVNEEIDADNQYIALRKIILKKNLNYLSELRPSIINYEIEDTNMITTSPENHTILIISIILGIFFGIIYILYVAYFNGQKR
tara:strand:- start:207 stop:947 length:741 start_codon:yes stop_codon:yes gene_type:complete